MSLRFYFMCIDALPACLSRYHVSVWHTRRPEKAIKSAGTEITGSYWLPYGCWDLNLGSLEE